MNIRLAIVGLGCCLLMASGAVAKERDPLKSRVPEGRAAARAEVNPFASTPESVAIGKKVFHGRGSCNVCHGRSGQGDGIGASGLDPSPRNLTNPKWQQARTDGELMYVFRHGSPGTAMITVVPGLVDEDEAWHLINFIRSLNAKK